MKKILFSIILLVVAIGSKFLWFEGENRSPVPQKRVSNVSIDKSLETRIDSFLSHEPWRGTLGLMFYDATAQKTIYAFHEDSLLRPASCMKMLTCITMLKTYGKSMVSRDRLYMSGKISGDTLLGNLTLKVQFDNLFTRDTLNRLVDTLKTYHIKNLNGKVILDMSDYNIMKHEEHWTPGDLKTRALGLPFTGGKRLRQEVIGALSRVGISVRQENVVFGRLVSHSSKLLSEIRTPMHYSLLKALKNSSNTNAEAMLYPLGYTISNKGNYRSNGLLALRKFIKEQLKEDPDKVSVIHDGCGLCPDDRLSPRLLVSLLDYAFHHKYIYNELIDDLPLSGNDGTLHTRLAKSNVIGKIKAKTGTLTREDGISTLSGYYKAKNGHLVIFSIMNNECPVADGRWWQDRLLEKIVE